jgi:hypothetical protein
MFAIACSCWVRPIAQHAMILFVPASRAASSRIAARAMPLSSTSRSHGSASSAARNAGKPSV